MPTLFDADFGNSHHTDDICFLNTSSASDFVRLKADSYTKYDIVEQKYDSDSPTYNITSYNNNRQGTTNAIKYISPKDEALLKSVKFYNKSARTDLRIHLYKTALSSGTNPPSNSFIVKNMVVNEWISIDTEDFQLMKNSGEAFDVGIEFLTDGAGIMGYQDVSGTAHMGKSFIKGLTNQSSFFSLNQYQIGGASLDGTWMIRLELATPYTGAAMQVNSRIESLAAYPIPFNPADNQGFMTIAYKLDNFGPVQLKIYNILGQLVYSDFDGLGAGAFYWYGKNLSGQNVASGFYIAHLSTNKSNKYKRLLLIR
jgi:hypothetical protein